MTNVPPVAAVNQPENLKPARVGVGSVVLVSSVTVSVVSALPPSELKTTVSLTGADPPPPPPMMMTTIAGFTVNVCDVDAKP